MNTLLAKSLATGAVLTALAAAVGPIIPTTSEFFPHAEKLVTLGIIDGRSSESEYRLRDTVTRAEIAKMAAKMAGLETNSCL